MRNLYVVDFSWLSYFSDSQEELCAEMGAAFLCGLTGIENKTIDNSAAYLDSWLTKLRSDKKFIIQAATHAQRATDYILENQQEPFYPVSITEQEPALVTFFYFYKKWFNTPTLGSEIYTFAQQTPFDTSGLLPRSSSLKEGGSPLFCSLFPLTGTAETCFIFFTPGFFFFESYFLFSFALLTFFYCSIAFYVVSGFFRPSCQLQLWCLLFICRTLFM